MRVLDACGASPFTASAADLGGAGYSEKEFFFEGEAKAYALSGEMPE